METADVPSSGDNLEYVAKVKGLGEYKISLNTFALEKKRGAFALFAKVSEVMGESFSPFVEPILPIISEHMRFEYSKEIRKSALDTFDNILEAIGESRNVNLFQEAFPMYLEQL